MSNQLISGFGSKRCEETFHRHAACDSRKEERNMDSALPLTVAHKISAVHPSFIPRPLGERKWRFKAHFSAGLREIASRPPAAPACGERPGSYSISPDARRVL